MAKVITFSRQFPKGHPRAGEHTYFVEQVLTSLLGAGIYTSFQSLLFLNEKSINDPASTLSVKDVGIFWDSLHKSKHLGMKRHTVRNGHHWKQGAEASLRVWSGTPYNSPQIIIAPNVEVKKIYDFGIRKHWTYGYAPYLNDVIVSPLKLWDIAKNDGLSSDDFKAWFKWGKQEFNGQIICWGEVNY